jgi:hypothetical protein
MKRKLIDLLTFAAKLPRTAHGTKSHDERHSSGVLKVGRFRRSFIYRPLAIGLAILLVPSFFWFESTAGIDLGASAQAFQASAQVIGSCSPSPSNAIIRTDCPGGLIYARDLYQFESDSVTAYLALHNLPPTDAHLIYDDGRADLRNAIRAVMLSTLLGIIAKPAAARTTHEQTLYNWLQSLVQQNEIAEYTSAINQYHVWQNDPCNLVVPERCVDECVH